VQLGKVLLLENIHDVAVARLKSEGYEVETLGRALDEDELIAALPGVRLLGIRSKTKVSAKAIAAATDLRAIGAFCIGTDQVDLPAAAASGVAVFNAPFSNTRSVVELAIAEIIALTRRLTEKSAGMHRGVWDKSAEGSHEVRGRTLGIVGYGNIGSQLAVLAEAIGLRVIYYDHTDKLHHGNVEPTASLEELLAKADVVTLHVPETSATQGMIGEREIAAMKAGAILINNSRGTVVDLDALAAALRASHPRMRTASPVRYRASTTSF